MFAPLMGIPYPKLTRKRLEILRDNGVSSLAHMGGTFPPEMVPYNINHEVLRYFQLDAGQPVDDLLASYAARHAGGGDDAILLKAWDAAEAGIMGFPNVSSLYSTIGFTWYRLWVRPFVPDIEQIPQQDRDFYEDFMCTIPHNPNNVDLSKDVLFTLTTPERSREDALRIDGNVQPKLDEAIRLLRTAGGSSPVIADQTIRLRALRCWMTTQRNIAVWVDSAYGFLNATEPADKLRFKSAMQAMMRTEIANSEELIRLLDSGITFIALTDQGETPLMYGINLPELLQKRIGLMEKHIGDDPFIDMNYIERMAGMPV
jgi:hypothetical protein